MLIRLLRFFLPRGPTEINHSLLSSPWWFCWTLMKWAYSTLCIKDRARSGESWAIRNPTQRLVLVLSRSQWCTIYCTPFWKPVLLSFPGYVATSSVTTAVTTMLWLSPVARRNAAAEPASRSLVKALDLLIAVALALARESPAPWFHQLKQAPRP